MGDSEEEVDYMSAEFLDQWWVKKIISSELFRLYVYMYWE